MQRDKSTKKIKEIEKEIKDNIISVTKQNTLKYKQNLKELEW